MTDPSPDSIAPSLALIEQMAFEAISTLPPEFREPATHKENEAEPLPDERSRAMHPAPIELEPLTPDVMLPPPVLLPDTVLGEGLAGLGAQNFRN